MLRQQVIPELQVTLGMQVLVDPLAILRLVLAPMCQRRKVIILPVDLDAVVGNQPAHMIGQPLAAFRVAQVQRADEFAV